MQNLSVIKHGIVHSITLNASSYLSFLLFSMNAGKSMEYLLPIPGSFHPHEPPLPYMRYCLDHREQSLGSVSCDTLACGQEDLGIKPPTLELVDDQLYLLLHSHAEPQLSCRSPIYSSVDVNSKGLL